MKVRDRQRVIAWVLSFVVVLLATAYGAYAYGRSQSPAALGKEDRESVALYAEALDVIRDDYVDQGAIDPKKQTYGAIEGMLDTLGDNGHTRFLTPQEREQNSESLSGNYEGVGIQIENRNGDVVVAAPIEGSPADEAGMEPGDVLVEVDGTSVRNNDLPEVVQKVKGPQGTWVEITVLRGEEKRVFKLRRTEIEVPVASWALIPGSDVAYVHLTSFSNDSAQKLQKAFEEARGAGAQRFILDLRNNAGGRLDQAVEISEYFLEPGSVIYVRKEASGAREEVRVGRVAEPIDAPLAVLVNEGSASSSEILAGALRDNERALLIGQSTFGTGTVLSEFVLDDGSSILLGVAEWLTPDGDFIRESGIEPEIEVPLGENAEPLAPSEVRDLSRDEILTKDAQLRRAFEELGE